MAHKSSTVWCPSLYNIVVATSLILNSKQALSVTPAGSTAANDENTWTEIPVVSLQLDPDTASRACGNDDGGNWIACGQKPEQVTVYCDKILETTRQLSLRQSLLFLLLLFHSPAPSLSPLLSFPSTFLDI